MPKELKFYNVKTKKSFMTSKYVVKKIKGRNFAIATNSGIKCYRIIAK